MHEGIPILNFLVPKEFTHQDGKLTGVVFEKVKAEYDDKGRRKLIPSGEPDQHIECDDVLVAVGQENSFPWIERDIGLEFDKWDMPKVDPKTFVSTNPKVFFGGDAAFGPKNIIWAVAHGHEAAVSIDKFLNGEDINHRPRARGRGRVSQKMGIHEWSYDNDIANDKRYRVPTRDNVIALKDIRTEVELGYDDKLAFAEAQRCLNCDVQTVFTGQLCIECDACVDICPMDCITFTQNGEEADLRTRLQAPAQNLTQDLYVADNLKTGRVMVKDEDVCLHCGLCAERCPTGAWDMQKYLIEMTHAESSMPIESVNDFVVRFANVNGSGSASANELFARSVMRMGVPVSPAQHLPVEHPGTADLVRGAHHRGRTSRRARRRRPDGRDEPADLRQGRRLDREGRLPVLRFDEAPARLALPRRHHGDRRSAHRDLQSRIHRSAPAPAVQEHHLCGRARDAARYGHRRDREADRRAVPHQGHADRAERACAAPRPRLRDDESRASDRPADEEGERHRRPHPHRGQQRGRARRGLWRLDGVRVVSDHAVILGRRSVPAPLLALSRGRQQEEPLRHHPGRGRACLDRHGDRRRLERRARLHGDLRPRHLADAGVSRPRLFRRNPGGDRRCAARRSLDRDADAHPAMRPAVAAPTPRTATPSMCCCSRKIRPKPSR